MHIFRPLLNVSFRVFMVLLVFIAYFTNMYIRLGPEVVYKID